MKFSNIRTRKKRKKGNKTNTFKCEETGGLFLA